MALMEFVAALAIVLNVVVYAMKTMIPLRIVAIATNALFVFYYAVTIFYYGAVGVYPALILNGILLPLNALRLYQMLELVRRIKRASGSDFDMTWLKPFMSKQSVAAGTILFRKGDPADVMYLVASGDFVLTESDIRVPVGSVVGEMGLLSPGGKRTQTLKCEGSGELFGISYNDFKQLYYQNPEFGFYFLELTTRRMFENIGRLEGERAKRDVLPPQQEAPAPA